MFCTRCGNQINSNSQFCPVCGNQINNNQQINQMGENIQPSQQINQSNVNQATVLNNNSQNNKGNKNIILIIVLAIVGLLIIVGSVVLIQQIKLLKVDKELQEEAEHINDGLNDDSNSLNTETKTYKAGESVELLDGGMWYVISQSEKTITLLSSQNYGEQVYFSENGNYYENSNVKNIIENNFIPELKTSLLNKGGDIADLKGRILTVAEIRNILNVSSDVKNTDIEIKNEHRWLFETGNYWLADHSEDSLYDSVYIIESWGSFAYIEEDIAGLGLNSGNKFYVRPVIETTTNNIK